MVKAIDKKISKLKTGWKKPGKGMSFKEMLEKSVLKDIFGIDVIESVLKDMGEAGRNQGVEVYEPGTELIDFG